MLAAALVLFPAVDPAPRFSSRHEEPIPIVEGDDDLMGQYKTTVLVTANGRPCSGVLISSSLVLTAAHCVADVKFGQQVAAFVDIGEDTAPHAYLVESFDLHPDFCPDCERDWFDFAALRLRDPVEEDVGPFPSLITAQREWSALVAVGSSVTVVGFGEPQGGRRRVRRSVEVSIDALSPRGHDVSFLGGPGTCEGDSGAPLFVLSDEALSLVGIYSRRLGPECPDARTMTAGATSAAACWLADLGHAAEPDDPDFCEPDPERSGSGCTLGADTRPGRWFLMVGLGVFACRLLGATRRKDRR